MMANTSLAIKKNTYRHKKRHDLGHLATPRTASILDHANVRGGEEHTNKSYTEGEKSGNYGNKGLGSVKGIK